VKIKPEKFARKVTAELMEDIALWCGGKIQTTTIDTDEFPAGTTYIKVPVKSSFNQRQTQAFESDWVIRSSGRNFKVCTDRAFKAAFDRVAV
jgi:hypothetical protein